jgi:alcohol dehydrogenase class IV
MLNPDYAFETAASAVRFGPGVTGEIGMDLADLGVRRALVVTDATLARLPPVRTVSIR